MAEIDLSQSGIARWVERAVAHVGPRKKKAMAQRASVILGYELSPQDLGKSIKKSDGKPRGLPAAEMIAISLATGYPMPSVNEDARDNSGTGDDLFLEAVARAVEEARLTEQEITLLLPPAVIAQVALELARIPPSPISGTSREARMLRKARTLYAQFLSKEQP